MSKSINSVRNAAAAIKSGDVIWVGSMREISNEFLDALAQRADELRNVTIVGYDFIANHDIFTDSKLGESFKVINYSDMPCKTADIVMANAERRELPEGSACREIAKALGVNVIAVKTCPADAKGKMSLSVYGKYATGDMLFYDGIEKTIAIVDDTLQPAEHKALERDMRLSVTERYFDHIAAVPRKASRSMKSDYPLDKIGAFCNIPMRIPKQIP